MQKYFDFQEKHKNKIIIIILVITLFFIYNIFNLKLNADFSSLFTQVENTVYYPSSNFDKKKVDQLINSYSTYKTINTQEIAKLESPIEFDDTAQIPYTIIDKKEKDLKKSSGLLLLISNKNFFTPLFLNQLEICLTNLENKKEVQSINSLFDFLTIEKKGTRLSLVSLSLKPPLEKWSNEEAMQLKNLIAKDPSITGYLVSKDLTSVIFTLNISNLNEKEIYDLLDTLEPLKQLNSSFAITGNLPITYRIMYYLKHDLIILLSLCFIVILFVFYISFKSKLSMILPLILSVLEIIWTLGTMAILKYELSLINIVTPCMVLTLGSSYSVHILSEYFSIYDEKRKSEISLLTIKKIYKTILLAAFTTIAGFLSLLISKVTGLKEFGISVSIGIIYCALLSLTLLPIILSYLKKTKSKNINTIQNDILTKSINKISKVVINKWYLFIIFFCLIILLFFNVKNKISVDTNYMAYFPSSNRIVKDTKEISKALGGDMPYEIIIKAPENSNKFFLNPENLSKVYNFEKTIMKSPDILQNISFASYVAFLNKTYSNVDEIPSNKGLLNLFDRLIITLKKRSNTLLSKVISDDANTIRIFLQCYDSEKDDITTITSSKRIETLMKEALNLLPENTEVTFSGTNAKALRFSDQLIIDQKNSQRLAYLFVLIIASIAFMSFYRGFLTLIPVAFSIMMNYIFMYIFNIPFDMVTVSFASVAIGSGVDDAIHFLLKYSSLKKDDNKANVKKQINNTIRTTGRPIVLTTVSIVLGMMMLTFASYLPIKYFGLLMSIALMDSMLATIFILPSFIIFIDKFKFFVKKKY